LGQKLEPVPGSGFDLIHTEQIPMILVFHVKAGLITIVITCRDTAGAGRQNTQGIIPVAGTVDMTMGCALNHLKWI
jgi:hypothetical protein